MAFGGLSESIVQQLTSTHFLRWPLWSPRNNLHARSLRTTTARIEIEIEKKMTPEKWQDERMKTKSVWQRTIS